MELEYPLVHVDDVVPENMQKGAVPYKSDSGSSTKLHARPPVFTYGHRFLVITIGFVTFDAQNWQLAANRS